MSFERRVVLQTFLRLIIVMSLFPSRVYSHLAVGKVIITFSNVTFVSSLRKAGKLIRDTYLDLHTMQNYTFYKVTTNTVQNSCSNIDSER